MEEVDDSLMCQCGHGKCFHKIDGNYVARDKPGKCEKPTCACQSYITKPVVALTLPEARALGVRRFWISNGAAMAIGAIVASLIRAFL